jgi:hypothetical protein
MLRFAVTSSQGYTAKTDVARRNGARSRGPVTAEGKARSARNALRHGISSRSLVLHNDEAAALATLRAAMLVRHQPLDAAEAHWVEELVFVAWRQRRLRGLEEVVLACAGSKEAPALPSMATVMRYRSRLNGEWRRACEELAALRHGRDGLPEPSDLRWLADRIEQAQAVAAHHAQNCTNEFLSGTNEPTPTGDHPPHGDGSGQVGQDGPLACGSEGVHVLSTALGETR